MNADTKVIVRLIVAQNAVFKIQKHGLIPEGKELAETIVRTISGVMECIVKQWSPKKIKANNRAGDLFLNSIREVVPQNVMDGSRKHQLDAELYYAYVTCLLIEDLQEWPWARRIIESLLVMVNDLVARCRKKNHYMKMLEEADVFVKGLYEQMDTFKESTDAKVVIKAFEPKSVGDKLASQYRQKFRSWGASLEGARV